jgi:hypothetical protein
MGTPEVTGVGTLTPNPPISPLESREEARELNRSAPSCQNTRHHDQQCKVNLQRFIVSASAVALSKRMT